MRLASLLALALSLPAFAQKGLDADSFFDMETISSPAISPDGKAIVFSRGYVDRVKDQHRANLWLVTDWSSPQGPKLRELTAGTWRDSSPVWSPDGTRIAFLSDRDGTTQVHVMHAASREVAQLTRVEKAPSSLRWSRDGKKLAFTMTVPDDDPILPVKLPKKPDGAQWAKPAVIVDRLSWASDGAGPIPKGWAHIFTIDALTGGTPRQVTSGKYHHRDPQWSSDGKHILFSGILKPDAEYLRNDTEIYSLDLATGKVTPLTDRRGPDANPAPHGEWIAYTGSDDRHLTFNVSSIYLMDSAGGQKRLWAGGLPSSPGELIWSAAGTGVYYTMEEKGSANLYYLPLDGTPRKLTDGVQMIAQASMAKTGDVAAVRSTFHEPGSLVAFNTSGAQNIRKVLDLNSDVLEGRALGEADLRTPITQSEEYYRALKLLKKETLLVRMPEEFHGWRRPSHQLLQQLYLLAWFDKYRVKDH